MKRGYFAIGLDNPKTSCNVAGVLRASTVYGAAFAATSGHRYRKHSADTTAAHQHMPFFQVENLYSIIPYNCIPVAVDLVEGAVDLTSFVHPERAFYVFGAEDGTLGQRVLSWCPLKVMIPTRRCMNLAACVNVVLYDRLAKSIRSEKSALLP